MANSKIILTFHEDAVDNNFVLFFRQPIGVTQHMQIIETFVPIRTQNYQIPTPPEISIDGWDSAQRYAQYFEIDYNGSGLFNVTLFQNTVTIEVVNDRWEFHTFSSNFNVTAVIENTVPSNFYLISEYIVPHAQKCSFVQLDLNTSEPIYFIIVNGNKTSLPVASDTFSTSLARGVNWNVKVEDNNGVIVDVGDYYYDSLTSQGINISVSPSVAGATVSVSVPQSENLILEYSLNGTDWDSVNQFTGQLEGDYTIYVRDQFLCEVSKDYTVDSTGTRNPLSYISKANSINFSKHEDFDSCSIFKNSENSLAFEGFNAINYCETNLFQKCDKTAIQFKTNYSNPSVKVRSDNGDETNILLVKHSNNLSRYAKMDCLYYRYGDNLTAIYFEEGKYYNEFDEETGEYVLNGNLPEFGNSGQIISIEGVGSYKILDTFFEDSIGKKVMIIGYHTFDANIHTSVIESIYDILPFEIYEFEVDWSLFETGIHDVVITLDDSTHDTAYYVSENINIQDKHEGCLAIEYYNTNNRDIFYAYGIKNFIRIPYLQVIASTKDDTEINISDESSEVVKSTVNSIDEFKFDEITTEVMRKVSIALSCENIFINGLGYVKESNVSVEHVENTNLYKVSGRMLRNGRNISNIDGYSEENIIFDDNFDIPSFITDGTGFVKS